MQAVSAAYLDAWRHFGKRVHRILVDQGAGPVVVPGSFTVTAARGERVVCRYSGTITLPPGAPLVDPYMSTVTCQQGFVLGDTVQWVTVATLRVEEVDQDYMGTQTVTGFSFERAVEVSGFESPTVLGSGSGIDAITQLLSVVPVSLSVATLNDQPVPPTVFESSSSPWDAVQYYATALSVDVYCDPFGRFVIDDVPTLANPAVVTVDAGGVKVSHSRKQSRTGVPSVVVVEGNRTNTDTPAPRGVARDANPFSRTYYLGTFGRQQKNVNSPIMLTDDQCGKAAATILAQTQGLARTLTLQSVPMDFVEPGDVIAVVFEDGTQEFHIIDGLSHSSADGPQSLTTRTTGGGS